MGVNFLSLLHAIAGQRLWSKQHPECGGELQSPIHLVAHKAIPLPLPALEMVRYHNPLPQPIVFTNTGHSVSVSVNPLEYDQLPMIFGAMLPNMYQLDSFHFHWGSKNNQGSEHVLNGIQYPAEMHIIHRNTRYSSIQEAQHFSHGLTVLAFFFQLRDKVNQALSPLIDNLPSVRKDGKSIPLNISLTLASILPRDKEVYYTYRGSLTTPPCSEAVTWIVFPEAIFLSHYQMKKFRQLNSGDTQLVDNFRRAQRLGPRKVYVRRMKQGEATMYNVTQHYPTFLTKIHAWVGKRSASVFRQRESRWNGRMFRQRESRGNGRMFRQRESRWNGRMFRQRSREGGWRGLCKCGGKRQGADSTVRDNMDCGAVQAVERVGGAACASAEERDKGLTQHEGQHGLWSGPGSREGGWRGLCKCGGKRQGADSTVRDNMDCGAVQAVERVGGAACASAEERDKGLTQHEGQHGLWSGPGSREGGWRGLCKCGGKRQGADSTVRDNMDCGAVQAVERVGGAACASAEERDKGLTQHEGQHGLWSGPGSREGGWRGLCKCGGKRQGADSTVRDNMDCGAVQAVERVGGCTSAEERDKGPTQQ
uniref:Carbonic anhydrase n=1 Tax=Timema bartmani TaxID=61472 RepID=A0A7R9I1S3_9NEOP|nr:unnamed protein product [Timema bartmani]